MSYEEFERVLCHLEAILALDEHPDALPLSYWRYRVESLSTHSSKDLSEAWREARLKSALEELARRESGLGKMME